MNRIPLSPEFMRGIAEAEATYRLLVEGIPAVVYIDAVDDLSTNLYTSPQIEGILGFSADDWMADPGLWIGRLHPEDRERVLAENAESNELGEPFSTEYRLMASDGREVWLRDEAVLVHNDAGEPLFWRGVMLDITEQKRAEEKLRRSLEILRRTMAERRGLLRRLEAAQDEERRRIAADIHDDSIQVMGAADLRIDALRREIDDPKHEHALREIQETIRLAVERLRHLLFELRPPALDRDGLAAALRMYLDRTATDSGFEYELEDHLAEQLPVEVRAILFRVAQEAITNVRKHANASRLTVTIEPTKGGVSIRVADDGEGFDLDASVRPEPGHLGLEAMLERAELAGGWCRVRSDPGSGTTVECWLPREAPAPAASNEQTA